MVSGMDVTPSLAVLISGSGSNLQALIDAIASGALTARIGLVVSNRKHAFGLNRAEAAGVPALHFPLKAYLEDGRGRETYDLDLAARVADARPDLVVLAGWMHVFTPAFLEAFPSRVINLHPALPGAFPGTRAIERAFEAFQRGEIAGSGCMVHYVVPEVDAGPAIATAEVPMRAGESLEGFASRMHTAEHDLIVRATRLALDALAPRSA